MNPVTIYTAGVCVDEHTDHVSCAFGVFYSSKSRYNRGRITAGYTGGQAHAALEGILFAQQTIDMHDDGSYRHVPAVIKTNVAEAAQYAASPWTAPFECRELAKFVKMLCSERRCPMRVEAYDAGDMDKGGREAVAKALIAAQKKEHIQ